MRPSIRRRRVAGLCALGLCAVFAAPALLDAILVAPHAVFMDHRTRTGQVYLVNTGGTPEEVTIDLKYGYPATDSAGNIGITFMDEPPASEPSAAAWIRAYPRRLVLAPGQRQVVRLLASPPAGLPDGEYWSRLIATSRGGQVQVAQADTGMQVGVSLELRTVISVSYRKGAVTTGVVVDSFAAEARRDSLVVWLAASRQGNAAYLGEVGLQLLQGKTAVRHWETPLAVYHPLRRRYAFALDSLPAGAYTLQLDVSTARNDLDQTNVLPAAPVRRSVPVRVP
jgi:hypothetical protein